MSDVAENSQVSLYGFEMRDVDNRTSGREGTHDIKRLWQRSHEIIGMALQGFKQTEIAKILNITPTTVSNTLNSSLGKEKLSDMREERDDEYKKLNKEIKKLALEATATYHQIFSTPSIDAKLKKDTADTVLLDIVGLRAPTKINSTSFSYKATPEEIEEFKRRGIEAARESGMLIEAEFESVPDEDN